MKTRIDLETMKDEAKRVVARMYPELDQGLVADLLDIQAANLQSPRHDTAIELEKRIKQGLRA